QPANETAPEPIRLVNPMTPDQEALRTDMRASLLATIASNLRQGAGDLRLFELGRIYLPREGDLPEERRMLAIALMGARERTWAGGGQALDFFDLKGVLEALLQQLNLPVRFEAAGPAGYHAGRTAQVLIDGV